MTLDGFFEKFDLLADAPNAVPKMRELVLRLAVHGQLVDQDCNDDPAPVFLSQIQAHKLALFNTGKLRGPTTVSPMVDREVAFPVPPTWTWVRFGEIMISRDGERIPVSKEERETRAKIYDYYGASGVIDKIDGYLFDKPLLLIGEDGANLINRATPIAFMAYGKYWVNNHAHVLDGISETFLRYIALYINSINLAPYVTGSAQPKMNQSKMNSIPIAVPPVNEQERIVDKVNELMTLCDRLEEQQEERETLQRALARASLARFADAPTPDNLNFLFHRSYTISPADIRRSILRLAVQGKLVPQDSTDEPAELSFPKLATAALEINGDEFPDHWLRVSLGDMGEWRGGGTPSKSRSDFWDGEIPWVSPKDMKVLHIADTQDHISQSAVKELSVRIVPPGSLLMVVRGMILARAFPVALTTREVTINQDMKAVLPFEAETKDFLLLAMRALESDVLGAIEHSTHGTCKLQTEFLLSFRIPLPPLAEQRRIVAKVDQLMTLVDQLEMQLGACKANAAEIMEAVVAEVSAGDVCRIRQKQFLTAKAPSKN
jgi:type I restriction enzyme, S subunit